MCSVGEAQGTCLGTPVLDQWISSRHFCCMLCSCLAGLEGNRSAAHRQTGWSLHAGAGSGRSRTHRWQLFASTDHPLQRNAPAWVLKAQTQNLILTNYEFNFSVLTGTKMPFRVCVVLIYKLTWTTNPKTQILWIFLFISIAELVTKLYEAAVRKVPTSEEYHSHLFMAYARVGEYKKMQQVLFVSSLMSSVFTSCLKN